MVLKKKKKAHSQFILSLLGCCFLKSSLDIYSSMIIPLPLPICHHQANSPFLTVSGSSTKAKTHNSGVADSLRNALPVYSHSSSEQLSYVSSLPIDRNVFWFSNS